VTTALQFGTLVAEGRLATVSRGSLGGRAVAVKRARADVDGAAATLRREGHVLSAAAHPAIVPVLAVLEDPLVPGLVLGWADGGSLGDLLADGPLPTVELIQVLRPLAQGLDQLHLAGVAHLDVTVHNVLLAAAGPVLIDPAPPGSGTPGYTDPFVVAGGPASSRSDVFGLAACAHVALTGRLPRAAGGLAVGPTLSAEVAEVLSAGLHADPYRRPASPSAFLDRLEGALCGTVYSTLGLSPVGASVRPGPGNSGRPAARVADLPMALARTWPFDRWQEEADAARDRTATQHLLVEEAAPLPRRPRRRAGLVAAVLAASVVVAALPGPMAAVRKVAYRPIPRRLTALDVPLQSVRRPPQPLEANHDTPTTIRALACCPWPRTRADG